MIIPAWFHRLPCAKHRSLIPRLAATFLYCLQHGRTQWPRIMVANLPHCNPWNLPFSPLIRKLLMDPCVRSGQCPTITATILNNHHFLNRKRRQTLLIWPNTTIIISSSSTSSLTIIQPFDLLENADDLLILMLP